MQMHVTHSPIGLVRSPFDNVEDMPIQPAGAKDVRGEVDVYSEYAEGLAGIEGFSHIILIYHFHRVDRTELTVVPFLDSEERGVFATRAPTRPNHIGISAVQLEERDGRVLRIRGVDILNETPVLDIKPYVPEFDHRSVDSVGWYERAEGDAENTRSDDRFR